MTLQEILRDYIKISKTSSGQIKTIHVCKISWEGSHTPILNWELYKKFSTPIDEEQFKVELQKILDRKSYFKTCDECGIRHASGHMGGRICQTCLEKTGIVF